MAQTLLVRESLVLYGGNEVALGTFLGLWLLGIAAGAFGVRKASDRAGAFAEPLLVAQGLLPLAAIVLARVARSISGVPFYEPFPLSGLFVWSIPLAVPVGLATGAFVPAMAARLRGLGGSVTAIYAAEAAGALAGGAATTLLLIAKTGPVAIMLGCAVLASLAAALISASPRGRKTWAVLAVALGAVLGFGARSLGTLLVDTELGALLPGAQRVDHTETLTSRLTLARFAEGSVLLANGRVVAAFPDPERVERAAGVLVAASGAPRRVLVVGAEAADSLPGVLSLDGLDRVVWLVADPGVAAFARQYLPKLGADRRLETLAGDPIRDRERLARAGPFDAVWVMVDTPLTRADDRFLTAGTLASLSALLTPDGVLVVPVRSASNYVGARLRLAVGTVVAGVRRALPSVRLVPGEDALVLGSRRAERLDLSPDELARAYQALSPRPERLSADDFATLIEPARVAKADALVASLLADPHVQASRLERPLALFNNLLVRAEQEDAELARLLEALRDARGVLWAPLVVLALFGLGVVAAGRRAADTDRASAVAVVATGGAIGMGLDLLLLHLYQGLFGTLYSEVGWLFGLWMGGLSAGGVLGRRLTAKHGPIGLGLVTSAGLALMAIGIAFGGGAVLANRPMGMAAFIVGGFFGGTLIATTEALLGRAGVFGAQAGVDIEMLDHLGGALGGLGLGVLAIPVLGLDGAGWAIAGLASFGALALVLAQIRRAHALPPFLERALVRAAAYRSFSFRRTAVVLIALSSAAVAGGWVVHRVLLAPRIHLDAETLAASGLAGPWREQSQPVVHYRAGEKGELGVAIASRAAAPHVQGYGGPMNLLIGTAADGTITRVQLIEHRETPAYLEGAGKLFDSLAGKSLLKPIHVREPALPGTEPTAVRDPQEIDAITGATVTSRAVGEALSEVGKKLAVPVYGREFGALAPELHLTDPRFLYLVASLVLVFPMFRYAGRRWRRLWLLAHAVVGGALLGVQFSTVQVLSILRFEINLDVLTWTGLFVPAVVLLGLLLGPVYCGYLCPAGAAQELLSLVGLSRTMPRAVDEKARFLKYVILAVVVVGAVALGSASVERADFLRELWASHRTAAGAALVALVTVGSLLTVRFGCRYVCPTGAFLNLFNKVALLRRRVPEKVYTACDLGVRGFPDVDCLQCNRCLVNEHAAPASPRRVLAFEVWVAAALAALMIAIAPTRTAREGRVQVSIRPVDTALLKLKISAGSLSDKPAQYWHVVRPGE